MTRHRAWAPLLCSVGALVGLVMAITLVYLDGADRGMLARSEGPPDGAVSAPVAALAGDMTGAFRGHVMTGRPFEPEWLVRVKRVRRTDAGALWADAAMPRNRPERLHTIEQICRALSEYVTAVLRSDWRGVSVRDEAGAELHTREHPSDPCRPVN